MDEGKIWCVYCHTFPDGKRYIGITGRKPEDRWLDGMGYSAQLKVFAAIVKFGWDNIKHEVLIEGLDEADARRIEAQEIYRCGKDTYNEVISRKLDITDVGGPNNPQIPTTAIKQLMEALGVSNAEMARRLGVSPQTVFERLDKPGIKTNTLSEMARALGYKMIVTDKDTEVLPGEVELMA